MPKEKAPCKSLSVILLDFDYESKEKALFSHNFGRMQIWTKQDKKWRTLLNGEPYWWWFREILSDESDDEANNDSIDETESDNEKDNDESNE